MTLHILNQPLDLDQCLALAGSGDAIVLIEAAAEMAETLTGLDQAAAPLYALVNDPSRHKPISDKGITVIDWEGMVDLCCRHNPVLSW